MIKRKIKIKIIMNILKIKNFKIKFIIKNISNLIIKIILKK